MAPFAYLGPGNVPYTPAAVALPLVSHSASLPESSDEMGQRPCTAANHTHKLAGVVTGVVGGIGGRAKVERMRKE